MMLGVEETGGTIVCTTGRVGGDPETALVPGGELEMALALARSEVPGGDAETAPGGMLNNKLLLFVCGTLPPTVGLGLLLLKLPIGLAKPLLRPMNEWSKLADCAGARTET